MTQSRGQSVMFVTASDYISTITQLYADGFTMCVDLTAVDYLMHEGRTLPADVVAQRFEVVVNLLSIT